MRNLLFLPLLAACQVDLHTHNHYGPEASDGAVLRWTADSTTSTGLDPRTGEIWSRTMDEEPLELELRVLLNRTGYDVGLVADDEGSLCVVRADGTCPIEESNVVYLDTTVSWNVERLVTFPATVRYFGPRGTASVTVQDAWSRPDSEWTGTASALIEVGED